MGCRRSTPGSRAAARGLVAAGHLLPDPERAADHRLRQRLRPDHTAGRAVRRGRSAGAAAGRGGGTSPASARAPPGRGRAPVRPCRRRADRGQGRRHRHRRRSVRPALPASRAVCARLRRRQRHHQGSDRRAVHRARGLEAELQCRLPRPRARHAPRAGGPVLGDRRSGRRPDRPPQPHRHLVGGVPRCRRRLRQRACRRADQRPHRRARPRPRCWPPIRGPRAC